MILPSPLSTPPLWLHVVRTGALLVVVAFLAGAAWLGVHFPARQRYEGRDQ